MSSEEEKSVQIQALLAAAEEEASSGDGAVLAPPRTVSPVAIHQIIDGKYRVMEKLGEGGMGGVYRAEHLMMNRAIALKVLHPNLLENDDSRKRFLHEAKIASRISHPNAVTIFDFGFDGTMPYIAMEFLSGRTLKQVIATEGQFSLERTGRFLEQIAGALSHAHQLGIIHRDLKPDNIMVGKRDDGTEWVHVLDFGIAKLMQPSADSPNTMLTQAGMFFGTPQYMSPEATGRQYDARSDIYSLGIILYEMISGEVPFKAPSVMQLLVKHVTEAPVSLRKFKPELKLSKAVDAVIMRALEKDPANRYQSLKELVDDFMRAAQMTREGVGTSITTSVKVPQRPAAPSRRSLWLSLAFIVCLTALLAARLTGIAFSGGGAAGGVKVVSTPPGAQVYLDGMLLGETPILLQGVQPGQRTLLLKKEGHSEMSLPLQVKRGKTSDFKATLMPLLEEEARR